MLIKSHSAALSSIRSKKAVVDFEGGPDEQVMIMVRGVDTGIRIRLDGTGDGVMLIAGDKMYRHPVGDPDE